MSTVSGYQEIVEPFYCSEHYKQTDIPGLKNVFNQKATIAGSYIIEITYILSKKKQRGISGKKTRYCLKYRSRIAK